MLFVNSHLAVFSFLSACQSFTKRALAQKTDRFQGGDLPPWNPHRMLL